MTMHRREALRALGLLPFCAQGAAAGQGQQGPPGTLLNDIHSQMNPTRVDRVVACDSLETIHAALAAARQQGKAVSVAGGRHAMGGQQFGRQTAHLDTRGLQRVLSFDAQRGLIEAEAGIQWPALIEQYLQRQKGNARAWGIAQKQTGADRLTLAGSLSANAHGRGLRMKPLVADVESFLLLDAAGDLRRCSRTENAELFRLAIGGYGLFGIITAVTLRLVPRQAVERVVEVRTTEGLLQAFEKRIAEGCLYGDFQFSVNEKSEDFLRRGVFSCYRPARASAAAPAEQNELADTDWRELLYLAHADKQRAWERYSAYYLSTSGQVYWSDTHQLSIYPDFYHRQLNQRLPAAPPGTEMITEIYVPRPALEDFLAEARADFRKNGVSVIYGTIRLIERDDESFLPWARQAWACTIFNLHTEHTPRGRTHSADAFRRLIDMAIRRGGSYFLTYHRYATRRQVEACYPQFAEFLRLKRKYDPSELFQSEWYRHYRRMFSDAL